jgi:hypothetical protein
MGSLEIQGGRGGVCVKAIVLGQCAQRTFAKRCLTMLLGLAITNHTVHNPYRDVVKDVMDDARSLAFRPSFAFQ